MTERSASPDAAALPVGMDFGGNTIEAVVAASETGFVYRASDPVLQRRIAIKEYFPRALAVRRGGTQVQPRSAADHAIVAAGRQAFLEESRLLARIEHPALVPVLAAFEANQTAYRVMPWIPGPTLERARRERPDPPGDAWLLALMTELLEPLEALHALGAVHGHLHPAQLLLRADDRPTLLGFGGAARALRIEPDPAYAPPEMTALGMHLSQGAWTDLHALAGLAWFAATGHPPPRERKALEPARVRAALDEAFGAPADEQQARDRHGMAQAMARALRPAPSERPRTTEDFRALLGVPAAVDAMAPNEPAPAPGRHADAQQASGLRAAGPGAPRAPGVPAKQARRGPGKERAVGPGSPAAAAKAPAEETDPAIRAAIAAAVAAIPDLPARAPAAASAPRASTAAPERPAPRSASRPTAHERTGARSESKGTPVDPGAGPFGPKAPAPVPLGTRSEPTTSVPGPGASGSVPTTAKPATTGSVPMSPGPATTGSVPMSPGPATTGSGPMTPGPATTGSGPMTPGPATTGSVPMTPGPATTGSVPMTLGPALSGSDTGAPAFGRASARPEGKAQAPQPAATPSGAKAPALEPAAAPSEPKAAPPRQAAAWSELQVAARGLAAAHSEANEVAAGFAAGPSEPKAAAPGPADARPVPEAALPQGDDQALVAGSLAPTAANSSATGLAPAASARAAAPPPDAQPHASPVPADRGHPPVSAPGGPTGASRPDPRAPEWDDALAQAAFVPPPMSWSGDAWSAVRTAPVPPRRSAARSSWAIPAALVLGVVIGALAWSWDGLRADSARWLALLPDLRSAFPSGPAPRDGNARGGPSGDMPAAAPPVPAAPDDRPERRSAAAPGEHSELGTRPSSEAPVAAAPAGPAAPVPGAGPGQQAAAVSGGAPVDPVAAPAPTAGPAARPQAPTVPAGPVAAPQEPPPAGPAAAPQASPAPAGPVRAAATSAGAGPTAEAGDADAAAGAAPQRSARLTLPPREGTVPSAPQPAPPQRSTRETAEAEPGLSSPREACGDRTNFSLLWCMQNQCRQPQYEDHVQCKILRTTGDVP